MSDPNNLEGPPPTPEERAAMARELDRVAPTPGDKFALMLGQRPTPRTDAFYGCPPPSSGKQWQTKGTMEELYFARQLERELAEALETLSMAINSANARQAETEHARQRPTPRTDEVRHVPCNFAMEPSAEGEWVPADDMQLVERELAEAREEGEEQARLLGMSGEREAGLLAEIDRLKRWKSEQMAVESSWDPQAIGQELGLPLGSDIRPQILPAIVDLKRELAEAREEIDECFAVFQFATKCAGDMREQRDRLAKAGKALVDRWETPFWEDVPHTGKFIRKLSDAIAVLEGGTDDA